MKLRINLMYRISNKKKIIQTLPSITKYGSADILLQSSIKPLIKISTPSTVKILKQVAFNNKIVSLSANQIGLDQRVFVVLKQQFMKPGKWKQYDEQFIKNQIRNAQTGYQAVICPIEKDSSYDNYYAFQQCPSFIGIKFKVKIPIFFNLKYVTQQSMLNFLTKKVNSKQNHFTIPEDLYTHQKLQGFKGRVWDHQVRHLQGLLPINQKICNGQFYLLDEFKQSIDNIDYYEQLKQIQSNFLQKNLKLLQKKKQFNKNISFNSKNKNRQQQNSLDLSKIKSLQDIPQTFTKSNLKTKQMTKPQKIQSKKSPLNSASWKNLQSNKSDKLNLKKNNK